MFDYYPYGGYSAIPTITLVMGILGLILGIVLLFTFLPARNAGRYTGGAKWWYDFLNFNRYWLSSIIKVLFIAGSVVCLLGGLICLFIAPGYGLTLIVSSIVLRLVFELTMVLLSIRENTAHIKDSLARMASISPSTQPDAAPAPKTCASCGTVNPPESKFCIKCGSALEQ